MKIQWEVWNNYNNVFVGTYDTKEDAVASRDGDALYQGIFKSDYSIIKVTNE